MIDKDIYPIFDQVAKKAEREARNGHRAFSAWFTGLSGSGKSTIAVSLERKMFDEGLQVKLVDGDNIRSGLCNDLSFSIEHRLENIRRVAQLSKVLNNSGIITLNTFISPTKEMRSLARNIIGEDNFYEIYIDTPLSVCEQRDVKGLYLKARKGEIEDFTGIGSPYEIPTNPYCQINTQNHTVEECVNTIYNYFQVEIYDL